MNNNNLQNKIDELNKEISDYTKEVLQLENELEEIRENEIESKAFDEIFKGLTNKEKQAKREEELANKKDRIFQLRVKIGELEAEKSSLIVGLMNDKK